MSKIIAELEKEQMRKDPLLPHRVCPTCNTYDGKSIVKEEA